MTDTILHYIHDPLCGWCYAAGPMIEAASKVGISVILHGGGLWDPATQASEATRRYIREADSRIARLSGQPFSNAYLDGLLFNPETLWWSRPTIAAVLAAERNEPKSGLAMIAAIQHAHYVLGQAVVDESILVTAACKLGLDKDHFVQALREVLVDQHIGETRALMAREQLTGYPGFLLEQGGRLAKFAHESFYGRPDAFVLAVQEQAARIIGAAQAEMR